MGKGGNAKIGRHLLPDRLTEHNKDYITSQGKTPVKSQLPSNRNQRHEITEISRKELRVIHVKSISAHLEN